MSKRPPIAFVVREGEVKGQGRYLGVNACRFADWRPSKERYRWDANNRYAADFWAAKYSARVVAIVRKVKAKEWNVPDLNAMCVLTLELLEEARADERAEIVAWLNENRFYTAAGRIEFGAHRKGKP